MRKGSTEQTWKVALAAVAVIALTMALYVLLVERRSRREEDRLAAARLEEAIAASRTEILQQVRTEIAQEKAEERPGSELLPNAVLQRGEGGALRQVVGPVDSQQARDIAELRKSLAALSQQAEQSSRTLRRDLAALRSEIRGDLAASDKVVSLLLIAMIPLLAQLLFSIWQRRDTK